MCLSSACFEAEQDYAGKHAVHTDDSFRERTSAVGDEAGVRLDAFQFNWPRLLLALQIAETKWTLFAAFCTSATCVLQYFSNDLIKSIMLSVWQVDPMAHVTTTAALKATPTVVLALCAVYGTVHGNHLDEDEA